MSITEYLLNGALIALVLLQVRGRRLTLRTLLFPVAVVAWVGADFLRTVPTAGNDLLLGALGGLAGLVLGSACGLATRLGRRDDGAVVAKAGLVAAVLWVLGVGARVAFSLYATHGGGLAIVRFSTAHHVTTPQAWVVCLVLMALVEVVSRTAVLALKYRRLSAALPLAASGAAGPLGVGESVRRPAIMGSDGDRA